MLFYNRKSSQLFACDFSSEQKRLALPQLPQFTPLEMTHSNLHDKYTMAEKTRLNQLRKKLQAVKNDEQELQKLIRDDSNELVPLDYILKKPI